MKKSNFSFMLSLLMLSMFSLPINASVNEPLIIENSKEIPIEVQSMFHRIDEIKAMDKSSLTSVQKKVLRKELRTIKKELRTTNHGLYLSLGAIIIIVLLLILIL